MAGDTGYEVNKYGYSTRPMSDDQAQDLLSRLSTVLINRIKLSKFSGTGVLPEEGTRRWRDDGQRQTYESKLTGLNQSLNNISNLENDQIPGGYNIMAHEMDVLAEAIPDGEDPDHPMSVDNAKFIIKAIDGIAIINTILSINDIRNIYAGNPDGNMYANGLINNALRASRKVDETVNTLWANLNPPYEESDTVNTGTTIPIYQKKEYPHFAKSPAEKWYTFTTDFYRYINVINIRAGTAATPYDTYINPAIKIAANGFNFDPDISDTIGHADQELYIKTVLDTLFPTDRPSVGNDVVKYVKDFVRDYIRAGSNENQSKIHQPISSVFDYYVLDYLVQILEAEYLVYVDLLNNYEWVPITSNMSVEDQHLQYNDAPFYYSTCNGASCVGLCYGSCVNTCNGCGGCTGYCSTACGATCGTGCSGCGSGCTGGCRLSCDTLCTKNCTSDCAGDCTVDCSNRCKNGCLGKCTEACYTTCTDGCKDGCQNGCKDQCKGSCGFECAKDCGTACTKDSSTAPKVNVQTPNVSHGPNVSTWVAVNPDTGVGYITSTQGPYTGGARVDVGQNSMNYSSEAFVNNGYNIANGGTGRASQQGSSPVAHNPSTGLVMPIKPSGKP